MTTCVCSECGRDYVYPASDSFPTCWYCEAKHLRHLSNVARDAIIALLDTRDFLGYQLSHANGGMDDAQLEEIAQKYLKTTTLSPKLLREKVQALRKLIGDRFVDVDVVSTVFRCDIEQAREALK
jgi:hypothetical protein